MALLERVLARPLGPDAVTAAHLPDHAVRWAEGQAFPLIVPEPGAEAPGVLLRGLSETDVARLDFYEGGFAYDLREVEVTTATGPVAARVYFPTDDRWQPGAPWDLADWEARWGAMTLSAAEEVMLRFGRDSAAEMQRILPFFRARGWARDLAATPAPQTLRSPKTMADVDLLRFHPGYDGFFRVKSFDLRFRRFDGDWSAPFRRESFIAFDAALVLPYDPVNDLVLLIEQLRFGPIHRGDPAPWVLEPVAGLVDAGEHPADTARREAGEEAGIILGDLEPMTRVYASPGYTTEFFHCYLGLCDLSGVGRAEGGLDSENEDIRRHVLSFDAAMALVDSGEVNAAPLAMMLLWLARRRDALRRPG